MFPGNRYNFLFQVVGSPHVRFIFILFYLFTFIHFFFYLLLFFFTAHIGIRHKSSCVVFIFVPRSGVASCLILPTAPCEFGPLQSHKHYILSCQPSAACHFETELVLIYTNFAFVDCPCQTMMTFVLIEAFWEKRTSSLHHAFSHYTPWPRPKHSTNYTELSTHLCNLQSPLFFCILK